MVKTEEVTRGWRKLLNGELCKLYSSSDINGVVKSQMRWVQKIAFTGEMGN
jgi:hypothetical protein